MVNYDSLDKQAYKALEQYGIIGNLETCALVGADGSIDWLCLPHLESESVFGSLLDSKRGGCFQVCPEGKFSSNQKYLPRTNVLETRFDSGKSEATLTDFMPPFKKRNAWHKHQILFRHLKALKGDMDFVLNFHPRFNYGQTAAKISRTDYGIMAGSRKEKIFLDAGVNFEIKNNQATASFKLKEGEEIFFILQYNNRESFSPHQCQKIQIQTIKFWENWAHHCPGESCIFKGPWHDLVVRSGLVLKLLTHGETGSIAAAATTSLPETIGGVRNWDYRFNWIRDSVFTAQALYNLGHFKEARQLFNWYKQIYKGAQLKNVQIMSGLHGEKLLPERKLKHLSGYKNSRPVRVGNKAAGQLQLDIYGELLNMAYETNRFGDGISGRDWILLKKIVNHVSLVWREKDAGLWEIRSGYKHYVYSKIMCWVAIDRGIKIAEKRKFPAPLEEWKIIRQDIYNTVLEKGFNKKLNSFTQSFDSHELDAANLLIPLVGFLPLHDPRIQGTIKAVKKYLCSGGLVSRYHTKDGLPGQEGGFVLCTYWLVDVLALSGKIDEAEKLYKNILKVASPLGLFAEEINLKTKAQMGNFPQAFSHIGLINSALYLGLAKGGFMGLSPNVILAKN